MAWPLARQAEHAKPVELKLYHTYLMVPHKATGDHAGGGGSGGHDAHADLTAEVERVLEQMDALSVLSAEAGVDLAGRAWLAVVMAQGQLKELLFHLLADPRRSRDFYEPYAVRTVLVHLQRWRE